MLRELGQVAGVVPPELAHFDPERALPAVVGFVDRTDFSTATEDALTWLVNRLGLFVTELMIARHGGTLAVQSNPDQRFYLHIVVTGLRPPAPHDARIDPFAIAYDAVAATPRDKLADLLAVAERELSAKSG